MNQYEKLLFQLTVGEFMELIDQQNKTGEAIASAKPERRLAYGLSGLCKLLNCSHTTAQKIKNSGQLTGCYSQIGRKLVFDADAVLDALKKVRV